VPGHFNAVTFRRVRWFIAAHRGDSYVPPGLGTLTPFLHAHGTAPYIDFLKRAFGAVEERRHEIGRGVVSYALLRIGNAAIELGEADGAEEMPGAFYLHVGDIDSLYEQAIAAGAKPLSPPAGTKRGDRLATVEDPIGNQWLIVRRP